MKEKGQPMTIDPKELVWWIKHYPNLDKEDIIDILEEMMEPEEEESPTNFSDYLQPKGNNDLSSSLRKIISQKKIDIDD